MFDKGKSLKYAEKPNLKRRKISRANHSTIPSEKDGNGKKIAKKGTASKAKSNNRRNLPPKKADEKITIR